MKELVWKLDSVRNCGLNVWCFFGGDNRVSLTIPTKQAGWMCLALMSNEIHYILEEDVISIDGGPEYTFINIPFVATDDIIRILDLIGKQVNIPSGDAQDFPKATIPGKHIKAGRLSLVRRATEIIQTECNRRDIDLSEYKLVLSLEENEN